MECKQAIFCMPVGFDPAIPKDILDADLVLLDKMAGDQKKTVTVQRLVLAT